MTALLSRATKLPCDRCGFLVPDDILVSMVVDEQLSDICEPCAEEVSETFICDKCGKRKPWDEGSSDNLPNTCDACWVPS